MAPSVQESHNSATRRKERVEKTFFDTDFFQDSKILEIMARFGDAAAAYYQVIAFQILREGGPIRFNGAVAILSKMQLGAKAEEFLNACIEIGLFYQHDSLLSSERADREIGQLGSKRDKWRDRQRQHRDAPQRHTTNNNQSPNTKIDSDESHASVTRDSEKEKEQEREHEHEGEREPEKEPTPEQVKLIERAESELVSEKKLCERELSLFMSCGWRPMKKYPEILISRPELVNVIETYQRAGVITHLKDGFRSVQTWAKSKIARGEQPMGAASALTGWALSQILERAKKETDLERSKKYLNGAGAR